MRAHLAGAKGAEDGPCVASEQKPGVGVRRVPSHLSREDSASLILSESHPDQSIHHGEQYRCGDSAHKDSVNGFEWAEETPSGGHHDVAVTESAEVYRRVIEGCI